jgi:carbon-monoxide dehydrogenase medium subunit
MNTRILPLEYDYAVAYSLKEALNILDKNENVRIFAGGTDLIVRIKMNLEDSMKIMLDINRIPELQKIYTDDEGKLHIGAAAKLKNIRDLNITAEKYLSLKEAISAMGAAAVQNMGTPGGNFGNANPSADTAGSMMCYGAMLKLVSASGERLIKAHEFLLAPGKSVKTDKEIIAEFILPAPPPHTGSCFVKKSRVKADISRISITVLLTAEGRIIKDAKIVIGSVAPTPLYRSDLAAMLVGKEATYALFDEVGQKAGETISPRTSTQWRKGLAHVMLNDALHLAWQRAGGEI